MPEGIPPLIHGSDNPEGIPVGWYQARIVIERDLTDDVSDAAKLHPTLQWKNGSPCFLSDHTPRRDLAY
jgi:hypothetical protein